MIIFVIWLIAAIVVIYLLMQAGISWLTLHPVRTPLFLSPGYLGTQQEDVELVTDDGVSLATWWIPGESKEWVAVLAHGYLMNRSELSGTAAYLNRKGLPCLLFDFRCHGRSRGRRCTIGLDEMADVVAACRWVRAKAPGAKIMVIGSSMGAAAGALACGRDASLAEALVLDGAYSNLAVAVPGWWRFVGGEFAFWFCKPVIVFSRLLTGINPRTVDVTAALSQFEGPVMFIHGDCDPLATPDQCRENLAACKGEATVEWFPGAGHAEGRWTDPVRYFAALDRFLEAISEKQRPGTPLGS
ncbi:MAG: alpha/beta hydrolase [Armatimonadetes bacterium]|nr:alpha/beta hydrolase [Armatimonadota bacterium]